MNPLCKTGFLALLLANGSAFALHPVQGWYGGLLLGFNYTPKTNFSLPTLTPGLNIDGTLNYGIFGEIGGQFGYRCGKYRLEGQLLYNNSPYKSLVLGGVTIRDDSSNTTGVRLEGSTDTGVAMFNGYYDFFTSDASRNFIPYVGLGLGYAYVSNNLKVYNKEVLVTKDRIKEHNTSPAGQIILGGSYFLDDFTFFGMDIRYLTTTTKSDALDSRVQVYSFNLSFNGAFNIA